MTTFDDREHAFENKYAHEREAEFKSIARRNKLLGLWAAEHLGLKENERESYAHEIVLADFNMEARGDIVVRIKHDFVRAGVKLGEKEIREELLRLWPIAREQLFNA